ncbi:MAG: DEAD/DEAH box helicase, partial [Ktedonobacterales bacterium]
RLAIARGERVLIAAFTNQAVDNVLRRLLDDGCEDFVRLGHRLSIAPELRRYRLTTRARRIAGLEGNGDDEDDGPDDGADLTPDHVFHALRSAPLAAATTATWSAERFDAGGEATRFDLAIVDEASQLTVPALLGALRFARRFVLVGDDRQLPPLVVSEEAAARGLKRSLFTALSERWVGQASVALRTQYRMHPVICEFPSHAFYGGALEAGGAARDTLLQLPAAPPAPLAPVLDPCHPLVFVNVPASESVPEPAGKASPAQARVVTTLVQALLAAGVLPERIGVIAPYRAQVAAIRQRLSIRAIGGVTVDTVDRFQGAERQIILFSFGGRVMETPYTRGMNFLADPNRLNVALTRAQRKLILVGDRRALESIPLLRDLLTYCAGLYGGRGGLLSARVGTE